MITTELTGYLAAITAGLTLIIQYLIHFNNRPRIKLFPKMKVECCRGLSLDGGGCLVSFEIKVLNYGQRITYIEEIGIHYYGQGIFNRLKPWNKGSKLVLFSQEPARSLSENKKETFKLRCKQLSYAAEVMGEREIAYVTLSSGKTVKMKFKTTCLSENGLDLSRLDRHA